jgi:predicted nucleic acid-binding protein
MNATSAPQQMHVIDASVAVWALIPILVPPGVSVGTRLAEWRRTGVELVAPAHWLAECVSAIRGNVFMRALTEVEGRQALADLFTFPVELRPLTTELCVAAFEWAKRIGQKRAYDAFYLALADELGVDFWTADQRLANAARQAGISGAHWIGES